MILYIILYIIILYIILLYNIIIFAFQMEAKMNEDTS